MQTQDKPGLWAQTPPAIFPPILGLFGLGLGWRRASEVFSVPAAVGELTLGAISLLFVIASIAYLAKVIRRPGVLVDDLKILPGRAGASAGSTAAMLFAATLIPYSTTTAAGMLIAALIAHAIVACLVVVVLGRADLAGRRVTPVWHLTFVGFIVAPLAAIPLGAITMSEIILALTLPLAVTIWAGHALMMTRAGMPAPLRPTLAIHLAPICLFGIVSGLLGYLGLATAFCWLALVVFVVLLMRVRYLTVAGFSPLWGAFTFPLAALANLLLLLSPSSEMLRIMGGVVLIFATIAIPIISYRVMKMWAAGSLAAKTNAARI